MKNTFFALATGVLLLSLSGCSSPRQHPDGPTRVWTATPVKPKQKAEILALFDEWNASLATGDPAAVAALYHEDAVLIPTVSNQVRRTPAERVDYFTHFLEKKPQGKLNQANIRVFGNMAINSGLYTFTFSDGTKIPGRYTYVYRKGKGGRWLIVEHHSSMLPE